MRMSAIGTKQTSLVAPHMSAFPQSGHWAQSDLGAPYFPLARGRIGGNVRQFAYSEHLNHEQAMADFKARRVSQATSWTN